MKEWSAIIFTAITTMIFAIIGNWIINRIKKTDQAASTDYVDEKHKEALAYTDKSIENYKETEHAYREGLKTQINSIKTYTEFIFNWVQEKDK